MNRNRLPLDRVVVVGGAGFVGSHVVDAMLERDTTQAVTVYDNFSSGKSWHLEHRTSDPRLTVIAGEIEDTPGLLAAVAGHTAVVHLASNPDIARAATEPAIDFDQGTALSLQVFEAARVAEVETVLYASGSGVYGDLGELEVGEDYGPLIPVSTYGASKLAGEAMLAAYCHMFGLTGYAFRFGNVVGPRQTHGVGFDFVRRLSKDATRLAILGDGAQSKSYVYVRDVIDALIVAVEKAPRPYGAFNVATGDYITVTEIAELAVKALGREPGSTTFEYSGGDRGWKGDVPIVRLSTDRIRSLGWKNRWSSREAMELALSAIVEEIQSGRIV